MSEIIPAHQWTNGGDRVLMVRFVDTNHQSYNRFQWPKEVGAVVIAPDWDPRPECGHGLHAWPWGLSLGDGKDPVFTDAVWQVVSALPADIVLIGGKVKCREVRMEYVGSWWGALAFVEAGKTAWIIQAARGAASATAARGAASATGGSGAASATGESGAASATGKRSIAIATGEYSTIETGPDGIAAATADEVTWIARPGGVFIHRWDGGCKVASFKGQKALDGERITFRCGKVIKREKP